MDIENILHAQNPWWQSQVPWKGPAHQHRRDLHDVLLRRLTDERANRATVLLGPRQVGKSTILRQLVATLIARDWPPNGITYFDFKDDRAQALSPQLDIAGIAEYRPSAERSIAPHVLLLDEIHLARGWPLWLKRAVDESRAGLSPPVRIIVTSSAASLLKRGGVESGQGRWDEERLLGLTFPENLRLLSLSGEEPHDVLRRSPAEFERYLAKGGLPEHVLAEPSDELRRRMREDVDDRAIRRDLLNPELVGDGPDRLDIDRVRRLFVYLIQDSGAILNVAKRASDLGAHRATTSSWITMLRDACLIYSLEPFHPVRDRAAPRPSRSLGSKPRIYALEHGLIPAFSTAISPMADPHVRGKVFESVVLRHLLELTRSGGEIGYYRWADDLELDFVVRLGDKTIAIEVTSDSNPDTRRIERVSQAREAAGAHAALIVHRGQGDVRRGAVRLLPLDRFLLDVPGAVTGGDR